LQQYPLKTDRALFPPRTPDNRIFDFMEKLETTRFWQLVEQAKPARRFELLTARLQIDCSGRLSYAGNFQNVSLYHAERKSLLH
jgi:hypothetical protein